MLTYMLQCIFGVCVTLYQTDTVSEEVRTQQNEPIIAKDEDVDTLPVVTSAPEGLRGDRVAELSAGMCVQTCQTWCNMVVRRKSSNMSCSGYRECLRVLDNVLNR